MGYALRAGLTERVLGARLAKPPELRLSDWEARPLSTAQACYAALDAFACLRMHEARPRCSDVSDSCKAC
jgi:ribonuclease D